MPQTRTSTQPAGVMGVLLRAAGYLCLWLIVSGAALADLRMAAAAAWVSISLLPPGRWRPNLIALGMIALRFPFQTIVAGTCEQWIKEGKGAIKWTRLSCRTFAANAARLQLHALAYNLGNFLRTLATPEPIKDWSMTTLREKLIKIGTKVVCHARYVAFQMAEVAIPRNLFADILRLIAELRPPRITSTA